MERAKMKPLKGQHSPQAPGAAQLSHPLLEEQGKYGWPEDTLQTGSPRQPLYTHLSIYPRTAISHPFPHLSIYPPPQIHSPSTHSQSHQFTYSPIHQANKYLLSIHYGPGPSSSHVYPP